LIPIQFALRAWIRRRLGIRGNKTFSIDMFTLEQEMRQRLPEVYETREQKLSEIDEVYQMTDTCRKLYLPRLWRRVEPASNKCLKAYLINNL
jgi:hypothetical protein